MKLEASDVFVNRVSFHVMSYREVHGFTRMLEVYKDKNSRRRDVSFSMVYCQFQHIFTESSYPYHKQVL